MKTENELKGTAALEDSDIVEKTEPKGKSRKPAQGGVEKSTSRTDSSTVIYMGPDLHGIAAHASVFNKGLPPRLVKAMKDCKAIQRMVIPIEKAAIFKRNFLVQGSIERVSYGEAKKYKEAGENGI